MALFERRVPVYVCARWVLIAFVVAQGIKLEGTSMGIIEDDDVSHEVLVDRVNEIYTTANAAIDWCSKQTCLKPYEKNVVDMTKHDDPSLSALLDLGVKDHSTEHNNTDDLEIPDGWEKINISNNTWNALTGGDNRNYTDPIDRSWVALFTKNDKCWLRFSGWKSDEVKAMFSSKYSNIFSVASNACGSQVSSLVLKELRTLLASPGWGETVEKFASPACKTRVLSGVSFGGAEAEIFAACAAKGRLHELYSKDLPTVKVDHVYTFGGLPSFYKHGPPGKKRHGCWPSLRYYFDTDPIAVHIGKVLRLVPLPQSHLKVTFGKDHINIEGFHCESGQAALLTVPHNNTNVSHLSRSKILHSIHTPGLSEVVSMLQGIPVFCGALPAC